MTLPGHQCPDPPGVQIPDALKLKWQKRISELAQKNGAAIGIFPDEAVIRRVLAQGDLLLIGGFRALMHQIGHPKIAQGVADWSEYRERPDARLAATTQTFATIIRGGEPQILAVLVRTWERHQRVAGEVSRATHRCLPDAGRAYDAKDAEARQWVHATVVEAIVWAYLKIGGRLAAAELDSLWAQFVDVGSLFGLEPAALPKSWTEFSRWFDAQRRSSMIHYGGTARDIAEHILYARNARGAWAFPMLAFHTLPEDLRPLLTEPPNPLVSWLLYRAVLAALRVSRCCREWLRLGGRSDSEDVGGSLSEDLDALADGITGARPALH